MNNKSKPWSSWICNLVRRYLLWSINYPCHGYKSKMSQDASTGVTIKKRILTISLLSSLCVAKNLLYPWIVVTNIDFKDLDIDSKNVWPIDNNTYHILCARSNCTQFIRPSTGKTLDIRYFPILPICYPRLNQIYPPTTFLGPFGLFLHAVAGLVLLILGVALPLSQSLYPSRCDSMVFLIEPESVRKSMKARIKAIERESRNSYRNYLKFIEERQLYRSSTNENYFHPSTRLRPLITDATDFQADCLKHIDQAIDLTSLRECATQSTVVKKVYQLPLIRSPWWYNRARYAFLRAVAFLNILVLTLLLTILFDLIVRAQSKAEEYVFLKTEMTRANCSPMIEASSGEWRRVPETSWLVKWSPLQVVDFLVLLLLAPIIPCLDAIYYLIDLELTCWRLELDNQLLFLIEITRLSSFNETNSDSIGSNQQPKPTTSPTVVSKSKNQAIDSNHVMNEIRQIFFEYNYSGVYHSKAKPAEHHDYSHHDCIVDLNGKIGLQQVSLDILSKVDIGLDLYLDLMQSTYISFRLLLEHVHHCSGAIAPVMVLMYVLTYGLIVLAVWHSKLMEQFYLEHMVIVVASCLRSLSMIALMSNFHAKVSW